MRGGMAVGLYLSVQECLQEELLDSAAECLIRQVGGQQRGAVRRPVTTKRFRVRCWKQAQIPWHCRASAAQTRGRKICYGFGAWGCSDSHGEGREAADLRAVRRRACEELMLRHL